METYVKITHVILLITSFCLFVLSLTHLLNDFFWGKDLVIEWTILYFASGIGLGGYIEALAVGESRWIRASFLGYLCYAFLLI